MSTFCMAEAGVYRKTLKSQIPHMEFVLDSAAEIATLPTHETTAIVGGEEVGPCAPGSVALIPSSGEIYMMDNTGSWYVM